MSTAATPRQIRDRHIRQPSASTMSIDRRLRCRVRAFGAQALVFALGFDAHKDDPIGVLRLESDDFGDFGRQVKALGLPTVVVQEGGYAVDVIGGCLSAFLDGLVTRR
jgi:acetoin utilization deacetylase AcuC-like enzyme